MSVIIQWTRDAIWYLYNVKCENDPQTAQWIQQSDEALVAQYAARYIPAHEADIALIRYASFVQSRAMYYL